MAESYNKLRSKLDRAVAAYLVSVGAGGPNDCLPHNTVLANTYPNTDVHSTLSRPEVALTGLRRVMVHISIKGSAVLKPGEPNKDVLRVNFDKRVADTYDAMMQSDDDQTLRYTCGLITTAGRALAVAVDNSEAAALNAANNADMVDFTCQAIYEAGEGDGTADAEGCDWENVLMFEVVCSPSNVD